MLRPVTPVEAIVRCRFIKRNIEDALIGFMYLTCGIRNTSSRNRINDYHLRIARYDRAIKRLEKGIKSATV